MIQEGVKSGESQLLIGRGGGKVMNRNRLYQLDQNYINCKEWKYFSRKEEYAIINHRKDKNIGDGNKNKLYLQQENWDGNRKENRNKRDGAQMYHIIEADVGKSLKNYKYSK